MPFSRTHLLIGFDMQRHAQRVAHEIHQAPTRARVAHTDAGAEHAHNHCGGYVCPGECVDGWVCGRMDVR